MADKQVYAVCSLEGSQCLSAYTVYLLSFLRSLPYKEAVLYDSNQRRMHLVMSLQKTAGAHPLICGDSYRKESESMIHPMDKETSQRLFGKVKCGKGAFSSKGVL